jgi:hypothetical protein
VLHGAAELRRRVRRAVVRAAAAGLVLELHRRLRLWVRLL